MAAFLEENELFVHGDDEDDVDWGGDDGGGEETVYYICSYLDSLNSFGLFNKV